MCLQTIICKYSIVHNTHAYRIHNAAIAPVPVCFITSEKKKLSYKINFLYKKYIIIKYKLNMHSVFSVFYSF